MMEMIETINGKLKQDVKCAITVKSDAAGTVSWEVGLP